MDKKLTKKQAAIGSIKYWIERILKEPSANYFLSKLSKAYNVDLKKELENMTYNQLKVVAAFCAAAGTYQAQQTRKQWIKSREGKENKGGIK
jgi:hypothetical protein